MVGSGDTGSVGVLPTKRAAASRTRCTIGAVRVLIPDVARRGGEPPLTLGPDGVSPPLFLGVMIVE